MHEASVAREGFEGHHFTVLDSHPQLVIDRVGLGLKPEQARVLASLRDPLHPEGFVGQRGDRHREDFTLVVERAALLHRKRERYRCGHATLVSSRHRDRDRVTRHSRRSAGNDTGRRVDLPSSGQPRCAERQSITRVHFGKARTGVELVGHVYRHWRRGECGHRRSFIDVGDVDRHGLLGRQTHGIRGRDFDDVGVGACNAAIRLEIGRVLEGKGTARDGELFEIASAKAVGQGCGIGDAQSAYCHGAVLGVVDRDCTTAWEGRWRAVDDEPRNSLVDRRGQRLTRRLAKQRRRPGVEGTDGDADVIGAFGRRCAEQQAADCSTTAGGAVVRCRHRLFADIQRQCGLTAQRQENRLAQIGRDGEGLTTFDLGCGGAQRCDRRGIHHGKREGLRDRQASCVLSRDGDRGRRPGGCQGCCRAGEHARST